MACSLETVVPATEPAPVPAYCELHCLSNFSFGRGASHPQELVARAAALGYTALALTDECSVAGVVRAHTEAKKLGLKLLPGAEFAVTQADGTDGAALEAGFRLVALPHDLQAWGDLCEFITQARRAAPKGQYRLVWQDAPWALLGGCEILLALPSALHFEAACAIVIRARALFGTNLWLLVELLLAPDGALQWQRLQQLARLTGVPLVAAGNLHMHVRSRKPLQDVLSAVRLGQPVFDCGRSLQPNAEAHLRSRQRLAAIYSPDVLANTLTVAARCTFSLDELRYQYPLETVLPGLSAAQTLRRYTAEGALQRYPQGTPASVQQQLDHELALITELNFEMYFLTVHDIVRFARSRHILCQGRGSAANSAVCYCLGVTEVDPSRMNMLFERFISRERDEPPDIDVDFEHQRREEVIQYIYRKYGRTRAALTAVVISYRPRSVVRDVGRALGVDLSVVDKVAKASHGWGGKSDLQERLVSCGFDPNSPIAEKWAELADRLMRFPRHLSQHPGGFVISHTKLSRLVPIENAAMAERSIIQWDKDDIDAVGLLKVDVLALGMLSCIRRALDLVSEQRGARFELGDVPAEDPATYEMICQADTVGVFQIEARAQMSMLPRLQPRTFYDLVIEVAIIRPGPIQGGMIHPFLRRRQGIDPVSYPSPEIESVLERTLGIPIFQEQVMQIAMVAAGFSPGEADALRRAMAAWKRKGGLEQFEDKLMHGMAERGYSTEFATSIIGQIRGFAEYGFPESHAASFALLAYASSWLKCHEPAAFLTALLNSQPMGFYSPSALVQDAQRHGVIVLSVDVTASNWDSQLLKDMAAPTVRLGLNS